MELIPAKIPSIIQSIIPGITWVGKNLSDENTIYLTFDDGPDPASTPRILRVLEEYGIRATFFVTGENAQRFGSLMDESVFQGHEIANHGFRHLDGWKISLSRFISNVEEGREITGSHYFRPPYGRMTFRQYKWARKSNEVILWSVMPGDFMTDISTERMITRATKSKAPGDVIVLHDNPRFISAVNEILPRILEDFLEAGFIFQAICEING